MTTEIPHEGGEVDVTASGGTLDQETTFYRNDATLTTDFTLTLPSDRGEYVFTKDPQDSTTVNMDDVDSFLVGPIFHLPNEVDARDRMDQLLNDYDLVLIVTLIEDDTDHYVHFVLDQ